MKKQTYTNPEMEIMILVSVLTTSPTTGGLDGSGTELEDPNETDW